MSEASADTTRATARRVLAQEVLINVGRRETRAALLENGLLQEVFIERASHRGLVSNIYKGRVSRVLPGMQAAFIDIGLERPGFLHLRDVQQPGHHPTAAADEGVPWEPRIQDLLHEGQRVLVQVTKDPIATKRARLTTQVALASRFLVLMPHSTHLGVSHRIVTVGERQRLRGLLEAHLARYGHADHHGYIVRTAAEDAGGDELALDVDFLERLWKEVLEARQRATPPALVYEELPLPVRMVRDLVNDDLSEILIDDPETHDHVLRFVSRFLPHVRDRVRLFDEPVPLFERHGIEAEIDRVLDTRVPLRSGGHLVIEQTEAMTTVDVNSGAFTSGRDVEDTGFRTNMEAAAVIPRQLRLRNLGGIVVIDFIDMADPAHRDEVLRVLQRHFEADPARVRVHGFTALGLVELSRKRTRDSLSRQLHATCPTCAGSGLVRTPEAVVLEILRELDAAVRRARREGRSPRPGQVRVHVVRCGEAVLECLLDGMAEAVRETEERLAVRLELQSEPSYGTGQFDLIPTDRTVTPSEVRRA